MRCLKPVVVGIVGGLLAALVGWVFNSIVAAHPLVEVDRAFAIGFGITFSLFLLPPATAGAPQRIWRFVKAAVVGLLAGVLSAAVVLGAEMIVAQRTVTAQMENCADNVCFGDAKMGGVELLFAFVVGSSAAFAWSVRRHRLVA